MSSKAVYARFKEDLYQKVREHAEATEQSLSAAIEDLVERGLGELTSEGRNETLETDVASLRTRVAEQEAKLGTTEGLRRALEGQLEGLRVKAAIALAAQGHAQELEQQIAGQGKHINQLRDYLFTEVAECKSCRNHLRLYDLGQRRCPLCSQWNPGWLPGYQPPPTPLEAIRDGAALVGAATIVVALLKALGGGKSDA